MEKTILNVCVILVASIFAFSCKKNDAPANTNSTLQDKKSVEMMKSFFDKNRPQTEKFTVDASVGSTITLSSGTKITIPANAFKTAAGAAVTGNVDVFAKDILKPSNMILDDKPTATADGSFLKSFGEIKVDAKQNNVPLALNRELQKPVNIAFPIAGIGANGAAIDIPVWDGDTTFTQTTSGHNHENILTTISNTVTLRKGIAWNILNGQFAGGTATTNYFNLDALGAWRNTDVLYGSTGPKTTVLGYFGNWFNTQTGANYMGQDPSMLFFKVAGNNTLVKLYNTIFQPAAGKEGFISYQNIFPVGIQGTFLAISAKNEKFYAEMRDVTISTPAAGKNYVGFDFNLTEVTETQLLSLINQMNTK